MIDFKKRDVNKKPSNPINVKKQQEKKENNLKKFEVTDSDREDYHNLVDILFVIDTTSSMGWCFEEAKQTILDISKMFAKQEFDIKFAVCEYRDHPPQESTFVYKHYDLTTSDKMASLVQKLCAQGGGDGPEAVMDGLYYGLKQTSWRKDVDGTESKRFIFHICDAPPHGEQFGGHSSDIDWQKNGCPCKIDLQMIKEQIEQKNITYNLVECGNLTKMVDQFKLCFGKNFQETIKIDRTQIQSPITSKSMSKVPMSRTQTKTTSLSNKSSSITSSTTVKSSVGGSMTSNIFNKQIQQNLSRNLK